MATGAKTVVQQCTYVDVFMKALNEKDSLLLQLSLMHSVKCKVLKFVTACAENTYQPANKSI